MDASTPFAILFVCTGNICRSPVAAALTRSQLTRRHVGGQEISVASAGTGAVVGAGMDPLAETELRRRGAAPGAFVARQIDRGLAETADLVLTAERRHRRLVVQLAPRTLRTAFTMREFARLVRAPDGPAADLDTAAHARAVVAAARARRGQIPAADAHDDITDPYGCGPEVHHHVATAIADVIDAIVPALCASVPAR